MHVLCTEVNFRAANENVGLIRMEDSFRANCHFVKGKVQRKFTNESECELSLSVIYQSMRIQVYLTQNVVNFTHNIVNFPHNVADFTR